MAKKPRKVPPRKPPKLKSGFERKISKYLRDLGVAVEYEADRIPYLVPQKKKNYIPDFKLPNGIYVEGKGKFDRLAREKMALVVAQNPDKDIRMLFMRDNFISKQSKTRYTDWCAKNNIKCAVSADGNVPEEWLVE